jgi:hypothetical protein
MVSLTQLKEVMVTANLSVEGCTKLEALLTDVPDSGFAILPEGHPVVDIWKNGSGSMRFDVLSTHDIAALKVLRQYDTGMVIYSGNDGDRVVPMYLVYNDAVDEWMAVRLTLNQNTSEGALEDEGYPEEVGR